MMVETRMCMAPFIQFVIDSFLNFSHFFDIFKFGESFRIHGSICSYDLWIDRNYGKLNRYWDLYSSTTSSIRYWFSTILTYSMPEHANPFWSAARSIRYQFGTIWAQYTKACQSSGRHAYFLCFKSLTLIWCLLMFFDVWFVVIILIDPKLTIILS